MIYQWMLNLCSALLAPSFAINLFAPPWPVVLLALSQSGLSNGALKPTLSTYIAYFHAGPLMSFVYAGEGLGFHPAVPEHEKGAEQSSVRRWLKVAGTAAKPVVIYGGGGGLQALISTWITVFLSDFGHGPPISMQYVLSGYWAGEFLSRVFLTGVTHRYGPRTLLTVYLSLGQALVLLQFLTSIPGDAALVALSAFFLGPAMSTVVSTVSDSLPPSMVEPANSVLVACGAVGSGAAPVSVGLVNRARGVPGLPAVLVGCAVATGVVWQLSWALMNNPEGRKGDEEGDNDASHGGR
ncbi:MFS general substrate transporter [Calocera cornea HHB12733]|uniref:MFS general substrate transporter n=1 Tax=Calocera cornea HHB12733 TaxID=1353952 RepID=A0A165J5S1_9BASI|nr:MFS general substrate transporter [Calocera cornea HHB12733]